MELGVLASKELAIEFLLPIEELPDSVKIVEIDISEAKSGVSETVGEIVVEAVRISFGVGFCPSLCASQDGQTNLRRSEDRFMFKNISLRAVLPQRQTFSLFSCFSPSEEWWIDVAPCLFIQFFYS